MRNVNVVAEYKRISFLPFYINYEECKFVSGLAGIKHAIGFILTMRNVNKELFNKLDNVFNVLY